MRRILAAVVGLATSAGVSAADDEGPELIPPAIAGPVSETPGEPPKVIESRPTPTATPDHGAVLVVPGINTPRARKRSQPNANGRTTVSRVPYGDDGLPPLVAPSEMKAADVLPPPIPGPPMPPVRETDADGRPPLTLESVPAGDDKPGTAPADPIRRRTPPESRIKPAPRRPGGLFGRFLAPGPLDRGRGAVTVEPRVDPEEDEAIRKQINRQIGESLGSALRSYEVRVNGREVTVLARATRFWQKRAVRNAIEALPAVKGYRTRVDVVD